MPADGDISRCLSVRQLARHWQVAPAKVRSLIRRGMLQAIDLGGRRRQLRITPAAIAQCEQRLSAGPRPTPRRQRRDGIDPEVMAMLEGE